MTIYGLWWECTKAILRGAGRDDVIWDVHDQMLKRCTRG